MGMFVGGAGAAAVLGAGKGTGSLAILLAGVVGAETGCDGLGVLGMICSKSTVLGRFRAFSMADA